MTKHEATLIVGSWFSVVIGLVMFIGAGMTPGIFLFVGLGMFLAGLIGVGLADMIDWVRERR